MKLCVYLQQVSAHWCWYVFDGNDDHLFYPLADGESDDYLEAAKSAHSALCNLLDRKLD